MPTGPPASKGRLALAPLAAGIAALLIVIAAGAWYFLAAGRSTPADAARLSIVVLPFANLSNDPAQDYFADGVTENLTTELSRIRNSFVIARNTAFTFKGKTIDAKAIGKELGGTCHENLGFGQTKVRRARLEFSLLSLPANSATLRLGGRGGCCGKQDGAER
jgi:hypothetical protein